MAERDNLPRWDAGAGGYEGWYLTVNDRVSGRGLWIRMGLAGARRAEPAAEIVAAHFHPSDPGRTFGVRSMHPSPDFTLGGPGHDFRAGTSEIGPGFVRGSAHGGGHALRWELSFETGEPTYALLADGVAPGRLGGVAALVPNVDTAVAGRVAADGEEFDLQDARGQQGHVFGARLGERWAWAHCGPFEEGDTIVEAVSGQLRRGPLLTPHLTAIGVRWHGRWIRLVGLAVRRSFSMGQWRIDVSDRQWRLTGRIEAPALALVQARLDGPDGVPRYCHHSDVGSCRLTLFERRAGGFDEVAVLQSKGTVQAEWVGRTPSSHVQRRAVAG